MGDVPKCTSWLGHRFEARYSVSNPALEALIRTSDKIDVGGTTIVAMQNKTYVLDICTRCGCVVDHSPTPIKESKP